MSKEDLEQQFQSELNQLRNRIERAGYTVNVSISGEYGGIEAFKLNYLDKIYVQEKE